MVTLSTPGKHSPYQRRWPALLLTLLLLSLSTVVQAALELQADRQQLALGESFNLILESDSSTSDQPDFSGLESHFEILGRNQSSQIQIINGSIKRAIRWQVQLMPKQAGKFRIPGFRLDGEQSNSLLIEVSQQATNPSGIKQADIFIDVSAEPAELYVQQQLRYTVRLYHAVQLTSNSSLSSPQLANGNDALVMQLGDDKEFQTQIDGRFYRVIERRYAIFPQTSGELSIDPLVFDGELLLSGNNSLFDPFASRTQRKRLRSEALTLKVKPAPANHGSHWLPASQLTLSENWDSNQSWVVGEPVTRSLQLQAHGLSAAQLPELEIPLPDGLKSYPDQPELHDESDANGIIGSRTQKLALIPTRPGRLTLPAISIQWWDTQQQTLRSSRLPARTIQVLPGASQPPTSQADSSTPTTAAPPASMTPPPATGTPPDAGWWPWLTLLCASGWLATGLWWWRKHRTLAAPATKQALDNTTIPRLRSLKKSLQQACQRNDACETKRLLLLWAQCYWPEQHIYSLPAVAQQVSSELAEALQQLDHRLYAGSSSPWQGEQLWQAFCHFSPDIKPPTPEKVNHLKELYE